MEPGDEIEVRIEGIGSLKNTGKVRLTMQIAKRKFKQLSRRIYFAFCTLTFAFLHFSEEVVIVADSESYIQSLFADRIGGRMFGKEQKIYKFEKIKRAKRAALAAHPGAELIDFGVGEPDEMAFPGVVRTLQEEAEKPENRGYADNGIQEFKDAAARYLQKVYGVTGIDPETEVLHGIGSKPVLAMLPAIFINPGDVTLMTVPGYPIMGTHTRWYGGKVVEMPLHEENGFLPYLDSIPADVRKRAKLLYINYPNNPTGAGATRAFFEKVVNVRAKQQDHRRPRRRLCRAHVRNEAALISFGSRRQGCGR